MKGGTCLGFVSKIINDHFSGGHIIINFCTNIYCDESLTMWQVEFPHDLWFISVSLTLSFCWLLQHNCLVEKTAHGSTLTSLSGVIRESVVDIRRVNFDCDYGSSSTFPSQLRPLIDTIGSQFDECWVALVAFRGLLIFYSFRALDVTRDRYFKSLMDFFFAYSIVEQEFSSFLFSFDFTINILLNI